jgi:hypothetical protein
MKTMRMKKEINKRDWSASVSLAISATARRNFLSPCGDVASGTLALQSLIKIFLSGVFLISMLFVAACEPAPSMMENRTVTPLPVKESEEKLTSLEREIRDADSFSVILVFKRKDGGVFTGEDKKYLSANKPANINRAILTDDEKAVVIGSNFLFPPEKLEALRKRFVVEDHSKPVETPQTNQAANQKP